MTLQGIRVLLVEDEALISMMVEEFLADLGCEVVASVARLEEGVREASTRSIDLAVLDINLDGRLSYPIADVLMARRIPFLFATGYGTSGLPQAFGQVPVVTKPFGLPQFEAALGLALQRTVP
jgi:CheY-like chemotaxis protein